MTNGLLSQRSTERRMNLIDRAKQKFGSDYRSAKVIGVSTSYLSKVRAGEKPMSPEVASDLAEAIGEDPIIAAIEALAARAKTKEEAQKWKRRIAAYTRTP